MKKIRYGLIGVQGVGRTHLELIQQHPRAEIVALADTNETVVKQLAGELGARAFTDYRDLLDADIVDAVSIATPHHLHAPMGLACLEAGVHIFIEKPLANRISQAKAMVALAKANKLKICVGHQYRTHRSSQVMKDLIERGTIGKIMRVLWSWSEFRAASYYNRDIWRATWQHAGGGVLMNQASHDLDLLCWLVGQPVQVSGLAINQLHDTAVEDVAGANILFASGAVASFQASINQPRGYSTRQVAGDKGLIVVPEVQSLVNDQDDEVLLGIYADAVQSLVDAPTGHHEQPEIAWQQCRLPNSPRNDRMLVKRILRRFDKTILRKLSAKETVLQRSEWLKWSEPTGHYALMNRFLTAIQYDGQPLVSGESTLPSIELINAIILSMVTKKTVDLPIDPAEYDEVYAALSEGRLQIPRVR